VQKKNSGLEKDFDLLEKVLKVGRKKICQLAGKRFEKIRRKITG
jgi:hypothetical protein